MRHGQSPTPAMTSNGPPLPLPRSGRHMHDDLRPLLYMCSLGLLAPPPPSQLTGPLLHDHLLPPYQPDPLTSPHMASPALAKALLSGTCCRRCELHCWPLPPSGSSPSGRLLPTKLSSSFPFIPHSSTTSIVTDCGVFASGKPPSLPASRRLAKAAPVRPCHIVATCFSPSPAESSLG